MLWICPVTEDKIYRRKKVVTKNNLFRRLTPTANLERPSDVLRATDFTLFCFRFLLLTRQEEEEKTKSNNVQGSNTKKTFFDLIEFITSS